MTHLISDAVDLVLGRACLACGVPGPGLCGPCHSALRGSAALVQVPAVGVPVATAIPYDGPGRRAILDYKERGHRALAGPLGALLADAVAVHASALPSAGGVRLGPIPARRGAARGFDALGPVAASACTILAAIGRDARVSRLLLPARRHAPLKGLGRADRLRSIDGAFRFASREYSDSGASVILVDDVVTSGATLAEAVRVLLLAGVRPGAAAVVAAAPPRGRSTLAGIRR